jgi:hypothetical protein
MSSQKIEIEDDFMSPSTTGVIEFEVEFLGRKGKYFKVYFDDIDKKTEKDYKRILNGGFKGKMKQSNLDDAIAFLFDKKFKETSIGWIKYEKDEEKGIETDVILVDMLKEKGYANEKEYFQKDKDGQRYVRPMVDRFFEIVMPDTDYTKD